MDAPELMIPVRFDIDKHIKPLQKFAAAGKKTSDDVETSANKATRSLEDIGSRAVSPARSLLQLMRAQISLSTLATVGREMGTEFKQAIDYCKQVAMEFADVRQAMQQVVALKNQPNNNEFTVEAVRKGAKAFLTPQEWRTFQEQFQSFSGAYLNRDQARLTEHGGVSVAAQAERFQQDSAEFSKARGIVGLETAQPGGRLLQFSESPQTVEDLECRFGEVLKILKRVPTPVAQLMPQMSRGIAQCTSSEEAAQMLRIMSEAIPRGRGHRRNEHHQGNHESDPRRNERGAQPGRGHVPHRAG